MKSIRYLIKEVLVAHRIYILTNSSDQQRKKKAARELVKMRFRGSQVDLERKALQALQKDGYYFLRDLGGFDKRLMEFYKKYNTLPFD